MPKKIIINTTDIFQSYINRTNGDFFTLAPGESIEIEEEVEDKDLSLCIVATDSPGGILTYVGYAVSGTERHEPFWAIKKRFVEGTEELWLWVEGRVKVFKFVWDLRVTYSYS